MSLTVHRGAFFHCLDDPATAPEAAVHCADGAIAVENGTIAASGLASEMGDWIDKADQVVVHPDALLVPGFVDAHVHFPQVDVVGSYGAQLLDWLNDYTFPAEIRFADRAHAAEIAEFFLDQLLAHGTTTALVFSTIHEAATDALFEAAQARRMRLIAGKVLMDRNAPDALLESADAGIAASERLIKRWQGRDRLGYAITPRFAPTCSEDCLDKAGKLLAAYPDVLLHTHLSENTHECGWVQDLFPQSKSYLDAYDRFGLVGPRSVFAHAIHVTDDECRRLGSCGASVAFCPTSNLFLGSGLFDFTRVHGAGIKIALATDIGAGTNYSLLATMGEAYKVCQLQGRGLEAVRSFYHATLGGARALGLGDRIGNFAPGMEADFCVLDLAATPLLQRRVAAAKDWRELLFVLTILGDDRTIRHTYIEGETR